MSEIDDAYDDYYDAAKKDGEPTIQSRHGGTIYNTTAGNEERAPDLTHRQMNLVRRYGDGFINDEIRALSEWRDAALPEQAPARCPTCDSPSPRLHPAVQHEGEVELCKDKWHGALPEQAGGALTERRLIDPEPWQTIAELIFAASEGLWFPTVPELRALADARAPAAGGAPTAVEEMKASMLAACDKAELRSLLLRAYKVALRAPHVDPETWANALADSLRADPRRWTRAMQDAWHSNLPKMQQAFAALTDAALAPPPSEPRANDSMAEREVFVKLLLDWHGAVCAFGAQSETAHKHLERLVALLQPSARPAEAPAPQAEAPGLWNRIQKLIDDAEPLKWEDYSGKDVARTLVDWLKRALKDCPELRAPQAPKGLTEAPLQPIDIDEHGVVRFRANAIVKFLLDRGPTTMNDLAVMGFSDADSRQFAQLIGYSVSGYGDLFCAAGDESVERADALAAALLTTTERN